MWIGGLKTCHFDPFRFFRPVFALFSPVLDDFQPCLVRFRSGSLPSKREPTLAHGTGAQ